MDTKFVILAAGMSTRLGSLIPKPLVSLKDEKAILDYQIENIVKYTSYDNIYIVTGYKKEIIMERYPDLIYVYNEAYVHTNTAKSLLRALKKIKNDTVWLNGDIYFEDKVLKKLINTEYSSVLVDNKICGEEEIKYTQDKDGFLLKISKEVRNPSGEALGINLIKEKDIDTFVKHLEAVGSYDYFEKAIENMIKADKVKIKAINIGNLFCKEIDFEEDLKEVREYLHNKKRPSANKNYHL